VAKAEFRKLIHTVSDSHGASAGDERTQFARHLLELGEPRAAIRERLMDR